MILVGFSLKVFDFVNPQKFKISQISYFAILTLIYIRRCKISQGKKNPTI